MLYITSYCVRWTVQRSLFPWPKLKIWIAKWIDISSLWQKKILPHPCSFTPSLVQHLEYSNDRFWYLPHFYNIEWEQGDFAMFLCVKDCKGNETKSNIGLLYKWRNFNGTSSWFSEIMWTWITLPITYKQKLSICELALLKLSTRGNRHSGICPLLFCTSALVCEKKS